MFILDTQMIRSALLRIRFKDRRVGVAERPPNVSEILVASVLQPLYIERPQVAGGRQARQAVDGDSDSSDASSPVGALAFSERIP